MNNDLKSISGGNATDHLANERTFLAWVRTSLGIMAFGFVVEKFALFMKQIAYLLGHSNNSTPIYLPSHPLQTHSSIFGMLIVAFGTIICFLAFIKYKQVEKQIKNNAYQPSDLLNVVLTVSVLLIGAFLVLYLNNSF